MFAVVCDKAFVPALSKLDCCCVTENNGEILVETSNPVLCQKAVDRLMKGYKLLFGNTYRDIINCSNYFTL
jgi:hypothetical protein